MVSKHALEVERHHEAYRACAEERHEARRHAQREHPTPEQAKVEHRSGGAQFPHDERRHKRNYRRSGKQDQRGRPAQPVAVRHKHEERHQRRR